MPFVDRRDAGRQLARLLEHHRAERPLVLGLARGGVPVAYEVAEALEAPLDVFVARKLGAPQHPEFAVGAIAPGGVRVVHADHLRALGVDAATLDGIVAKETRELRRRLLHYRGSEEAPPVQDRVVVLVDDGLATGATAKAAVRGLRRLGARRIVLAVPVGAPDSIAQLDEEADEVVAVEAPADFRAVGLWYDDFRPTRDDEVVDLLRRARRHSETRSARGVEIDVGGGKRVAGDLVVPPQARGIVLFVHGSGSGRFSPRNRHVARQLQAEGLATLLLDLLTPEEEAIDLETRHLRFDIPFLAARVARVVAWLRATPQTAPLRVGLFGASTGGAAALVAAAQAPTEVAAVVSRGGRPDLAGDALARVWAPVLLVVGARDHPVLALNREALAQIPGEKALRIVPDATHLFEEPGALDEVARLAAAWFVGHLQAPERPGPEVAGRH